jgi:SEC-C motif domain protein
MAHFFHKIFTIFECNYTKNMNKRCTCGSDKNFEQCCEPIIKGELQAITAEELMRSRYSAYVIVAANYLFLSTHISIRVKHSEIEMEDWAKENKWQKLKIMFTNKGKKDDTIGEVEFKAYYIDAQNKPQIHHEKSVFVKEKGVWYYLKGKIY